MTLANFFQSGDLYLLIGAILVAALYFKERPGLRSLIALTLYVVSFIAFNAWELVVAPPEVIRPARFETLDQAVAYIEAFERNVSYLKEVFLLWGIGLNIVVVCYACVVLREVLISGTLLDKLLYAVLVVAEVYTLFFQTINCNVHEGMSGADLAKIIGSAVPSSVCEREFSLVAEAIPTIVQLVVMLGLWVIWKRSSPKHFGES